MHPSKYCIFGTFGTTIPFLGQAVMDIIATRITLFLSNRIGLNIISDYLKKLMSLPIKFFDSKLIGDLIERANDHE